jgi:putative flippase GtrA
LIRGILNFIASDRQQMLIYAAGGIVATILNLLVIYVSRMAVTYAVAVLIGAIAATIVSFINAKYFVFKKRQSARQLREMVKFLCVHSGASLLYWCVSVALAGLLALHGPHHYAEAISSLVGVSTFAVTGFLGHRFITFAPTPDGR